MADPTKEEVLLPNEVSTKTESQQEDAERIRQTVADVYTFVRSRELNQAIANFTFDHYIEEAKQKIKGTGRDIRDAAGQNIDIRPTQLEALTQLEETFNKSMDDIETLVKQADENFFKRQGGGDITSSPETATV